MFPYNNYICKPNSIFMSDEKVRKKTYSTQQRTRNNSSEDSLLLSQICLTQEQLDPLINELRLLAGSIHNQQSTNLPKAFHLYFNDIGTRFQQFNQQAQKLQSGISSKQMQISELKLELKASKNDFAEMKSSLILQMEEQRTVVDHLKEEIKLQRERLSNTMRGIMQESRSKDQEMKKLKEECQNEIKKVKERVQIGKNGEIQEEGSRERTKTLHQKQKNQLLKSQTMKKQRNKDELNILLKAAKVDLESEQGSQLGMYIQSIQTKIYDLEMSILERQQQINTYICLQNLTNSRTLESSVILSQQTQEISELKEKIVKLTKSAESKENQIEDLRSIIDRYLKEKQESNKYLGTKWEHEIQRVMLNAEIEFDREKNRIKRAGEQRLAEVEKLLGNKIQNLRQQNRNIRQNKLKKAIQKVRQLENTVKNLQDESLLEQENHNQQLEHFKKVIDNMKHQIQDRVAAHRSTKNLLQQQKIKYKEAFCQLQYIKTTLHEKKASLESQNKKQLEKQQVEIEKQKHTFLTQSKVSYEQIVKKFEEDYKIRQAKQQQEFQRKCQQLFIEVKKTKKEHEQLCQAKIKQILEQKQDLKKAYQRSIRASKQEQRSKHDEHVKAKSKLNNQIKQLKEDMKKKEEQISKNKETIQTLNKEKKGLFQSINIKNNEVLSMRAECENKQGQYRALQSQYQEVSLRHQQVYAKYSNVQSQILDLKKFFLKEHSYLKQHHAKIVRGYRAYIKEIEEACFSSSDRNIYIRQIKRLKFESSGVETQLKNAEHKLITLKELAKYQNNRLERFKSQEKEKEKEEHPYKSRSTKKTDLYRNLNLTQRRSTKIQKKFELNNSLDNIKIQDEYQNITKEDEQTRYQKLSKIRIKKAKKVESRVGSHRQLLFTGNSKGQLQDSDISSRDLIISNGNIKVIRGKTENKHLAKTSWENL